jgi:hypothetical protein
MEYNPQTQAYDFDLPQAAPRSRYAHELDAARAAPRASLPPSAPVKATQDEQGDIGTSLTIAAMTTLALASGIG